MTRTAIVHGDAETVARYLPANYTVDGAAPTALTADLPDPTGWVLVTGQDNAGWTLDEYVIPRLASGLYAAREIKVAQ